MKRLSLRGICEEYRAFILREIEYGAEVKELKVNGCRTKKWYQQMLHELKVNAGRGFLMSRAPKSTTVFQGERWQKNVGGSLTRKFKFVKGIVLHSSYNIPREILPRPLLLRNVLQQ